MLHRRVNLLLEELNIGLLDFLTRPTQGHSFPELEFVVIRMLGRYFSLILLQRLS